MTAAFHVTRAKAPLRLGLAGGGTDLSPYCDEFGGAVLNCTIDQYAYAFISPRNDGCVKFCARDLKAEEIFQDPLDIASSRLALHKGVYSRIVRQFYNGKGLPVTITTSVDVPMGSGLGSSSALAVALVDAFRIYLDLPLGQYDVAHLAFEIERIDLGLKGGKQDQYAAAFGGANFIEFGDGDHVVVNPLRIPKRILHELEASIILCFSGSSRESAKIIEQQTSGIVSGNPVAIDALHGLKRDAQEMKRALLSGNLDEMARILDHSWQSKKATAKSVTNQKLDELYELARMNGAVAGKVSGAGGGGFMMFMVAAEDRPVLVDVLTAAGWAASPVRFTEGGCETWQVLPSLDLHGIVSK